MVEVEVREVLEEVIEVDVVDSEEADLVLEEVDVVDLVEDHEVVTAEVVEGTEVDLEVIEESDVR